MSRTGIIISTAPVRASWNRRKSWLKSCIPVRPIHAIAVPAGMIGTGDHYALEVKGDSMIEAGILEGDLALIKKADVADTGDIDAIRLDGVASANFDGGKVELWGIK